MGNTKVFLREFKQRLIAKIEIASLDTHHLYYVYSSYKHEVKTFLVMFS